MCGGIQTPSRFVMLQKNQKYDQYPENFIKQTSAIILEPRLSWSGIKVERRWILELLAAEFLMGDIFYRNVTRSVKPSR